jgi:exonuclease III
MLQHFQADIICICETHLTDGMLCDGNALSLDGYTYYDHSRTMRHFRAPHNFGGVGCFVKNDFAYNYSVEHEKLWTVFNC